MSTTAIEHIEVGKVFFRATTFDAAVDEILRLSQTRNAAGGIRLSNAWCVVVADEDPDYAQLLNSPGLTLPDGFPVAFLMKRRVSVSEPERVRGPSLFLAALDRGRRTRARHFFLGATEATLRDLKTAAQGRFPGIEVAGSWAPPFAPVTAGLLQEALERIENAAPDIVWVGMGSPKQDFLAHNIALSTGLPCVGVGAAFDFLAGATKEAPPLIQRFGLEWAYRLLQEPRRLWRRYLIGNLKFLRIALRRR